jgi:hypothetical protein
MQAHTDIYIQTHVYAHTHVYTQAHTHVKYLSAPFIHPLLHLISIPIVSIFYPTTTYTSKHLLLPYSHHPYLLPITITTYRRKAESIFTRFSELTKRPAAVKKALDSLLIVRNKVDAWVDKMPQARTLLLLYLHTYSCT